MTRVAARSYLWRQLEAGGIPDLDDEERWESAYSGNPSLKNLRQSLDSLLHQDNGQKLTVTQIVLLASVIIDAFKMGQACDGRLT